MATKFKVGDKVKRKADWSWPYDSAAYVVEALVDDDALVLKDVNFAWDWDKFDLVEAYEPECPSHEEDKVSSPLHYNYGKVETIDYIMQVASLFPGHQAVLVGNIIKYLSRAPLKGDKDKDLKKAQWYLNRLIETL